MKKKVSIIVSTALIMLAMVFSASVLAANQEATAVVADPGLTDEAVVGATAAPGVQYQTHIQNRSWETDWKTNGAISGTVGESLRLEAFFVELTGNYPSDANIVASVHVQNLGNLGPFDMGEEAGTDGQSLRLEEIVLTLENMPGYTLHYNVHVQNKGWLKDPDDSSDWFEDSQPAGTEGQGLRLEALQIKLDKDPVDLTAYQTALAAVIEADYTPSSWAIYQAVVNANVVTVANIQVDIEAATAAIIAAQAHLVKAPVIYTVTASAEKTLTITGEGLAKLLASQLTVENNTITAITPDAAGTSAIITLGSSLPLETNVKVSATINGVSTEYIVRYTIAGATRKLMVTSGPTDNVLDLESTEKTAITFKVGEFDSSNVLVGTIPDLLNYTVTCDNTVLNIPGATKTATGYTLAAGDSFMINGLKTGTSLLSVRMPDGTFVESRSITVIKSVVKITGITFLAPGTIATASVVNYETVLALADQAPGKDPIVSGVITNVATSSGIRIASTNQTGITAGQIYLDKNPNGHFDSGIDIILGALTAVLTEDPGSSVWTTTKPLDVIAGQATSPGNKGTITFSVTDSLTSGKPIIGSTDVLVAVANLPTGIVIGATTETRAGVTGNPGIKQVSTIQVLTGATDHGSLAIDGELIFVSQVNESTPELVAAKIGAHDFNYWTVSVIGDTVTFTARSAKVDFPIVAVGSAGVVLGPQLSIVHGAYGETAVAGINTTAITTGATNAGTVTVRFEDGVITKDVTVTVAAADSTATVAAAIANALAGDATIAAKYTVTADAANVVFTQIAGQEGPVTINVSLV